MILVFSLLIVISVQKVCNHIDCWVNCPIFIFALLIFYSHIYVNCFFKGSAWGYSFSKQFFLSIDTDHTCKYLAFFYSPCNFQLIIVEFILQSSVDDFYCFGFLLFHYKEYIPIISDFTAPINDSSLAVLSCFVVCPFVGLLSPQFHHFSFIDFTLIWAFPVSLSLYNFYVSFHFFFVSW